MAVPPYRFSAHDGAAIVTRQRAQLIQSGSECFSCSVIRIISEGGDLPERIERWRSALFSVPQTPKSQQMSVGYASDGKRFRESIDVELAAKMLGALRRIGLAYTRFARASCGSIRLKLLKIGALVNISVRRIVVAMATAFPYQHEFVLAHALLRRTGV